MRFELEDLKGILRRRLPAKLIDESDKGSERGLEELALLDAALSQVGDDFTRQAKAKALQKYRGKRGKRIAGERLVVEWRPAGESTLVDSAAVRKAYPQESRPELYKTAAKKEGVIFNIAAGDA